MKFKRSYVALCMLLFALCTFQLVGCGSSGGETTSDSGGTTTTGGVPSSAAISATSTSVQADGTETATISVTVKDANGKALSKVAVTFATDLGTLVATAKSASDSVTVLTNTSGVASADLTSAIPGVATITVTVGDITKTFTVTFTAVPDVFALTASKISVKTDNSDSATITATVLDINRVPINGIVVTFKTIGEDGNPAGQISAASAVTNSSGEASIVFRSGTVQKINQVVTIEATVAGIADSKTLPILVTGTKITLSTSGSTNLVIGGDATNTLTLTLTDAGDNPINNTAITLTDTPDGVVTLALAAGYTSYTTDISGVLKVDVTGVSTGAATVTAEALGAAASQAYSVGAVGAVFGIETPSEDPFSAQRLDTVGIASGAMTFADVGTADTITAPAGTFALFSAGDKIMVDGTASNDGVYTIFSIDGASAVLTLSSTDSLTAEGPAAATVTNGVLVKVLAPTQNNVVFAATIGTWDGGTDAVVTKPVIGGYASAVFSSDLAGLATIQVYDKDNASTTDSVTVAISAPSSEAAKIILQSSAYVVLPSVGVTYTATLTAKVTTIADQAVGGAPVLFSIIDPVGGGEKISPVVVFTNDSGIATATFTSGSIPTSAQGMEITASVVGMPAVTPSSIHIVIGGTAGSVFIGRGSKIKVLNTTTYALPMSVLVADSSGAGLEGQEVSLTLWPASYSTGGWYDSDPEPDNEKWLSYVSGTFINEDINENLILDAGEDVNFDEQLTPPNSAAGAIVGPGGEITVTTDENGIANFDLVFLKESAVWITDRVRASTEVQGTEISSSLTFGLPYLKAEGDIGDLKFFAGEPITLKVDALAGSFVSYQLPAFEGSVDNTYSTTQSPDSSIGIADLGPPIVYNGLYTYTAPVAPPLTAGQVIWDYVTIADPDTLDVVNITIPIRIVVQ